MSHLNFWRNVFTLALSISQTHIETHITSLSLIHSTWLPYLFTIIILSLSLSLSQSPYMATKPTLFTIISLSLTHTPKSRSFSLTIHGYNTYTLYNNLFLSQTARRSFSHSLVLPLVLKWSFSKTLFSLTHSQCLSDSWLYFLVTKTAQANKHSDKFLWLKNVYSDGGKIVKKPFQKFSSVFCCIKNAI